jgi:16S rRNA (cytidine1402-2'-O)-methyltransferase
MAEGTLFVVATPIGNLEDITFRAIETLKLVDLVLAEDTRNSGKLLKHYGITTPMRSYHAHSRGRKHDQILTELDEGKSMALITDAGTPAISDPGSKLVEMARRAGRSVVPIPGASAVTTALSATGLGGDEYTFLGFLPHKKGRQTKLDKLGGMCPPVVLYESPHRLVKLLGELDARYPEAQVTVARELTKKFEEFAVGTPSHLADRYTEHPPKGEIVVVIRI